MKISSMMIPDFTFKGMCKSLYINWIFTYDDK